MKMKHIGIIGVSSEGAALCYRTICEEGFAKIGKFIHPEITINTLPLIDYINCFEKNDWNTVASLMLKSTKTLASAGADFAICPDNTVHYAFDILKINSPIPLLSIVEIAAKECQTKGYKKVGILGTKYTMQGGLYNKALTNFGIESVIPNEDDIEIVNTVIFNELSPGQVSDASSKPLIEVIKKLKKSGCTAVILGCTELPLVINQNNSSLPPIDTTRLQARKALEFALKI